MEKISPKIGMAPIMAFSATFSPIRSNTIFGNRYCAAIRIMAEPVRLAIISAMPGIKPSIGSGPMRSDGPGEVGDNIADARNDTENWGETEADRRSRNREALIEPFGQKLCQQKSV